MLQPWVQGTITQIIDETPTTKRFFFEVPEWEVFDFAPGQFVTLDLPIHEQKNKRWRSYSIASAPNGTNGFELVIVKLEGGLGTTWLWEKAVVGIEITLRGPQGKFVLPENIESDLFLICTGTGIAPFRSMVHHIKNKAIPFKNLYLIFGCRKIQDGLYFDELNALQKEMPGFFYMPTYSREPLDNAAGVSVGYVHKVYKEILQKRSANISNADNVLQPTAKFYLCGWKEMIDEARKNIQEAGYDKKDIHFELYG